MLIVVQIQERQRVLKLGYIPARQGALTKDSTSSTLSTQRRIPVHDDEASRTSALYEREAARGFSENEEAFAAEEDLVLGRPSWADKYKPRKPRYFNRVQLGYEWNKYNQTHYDHDNPPPKVVQGYKFNIFYPDLVDPTKAPTFKIERENGRKRGQSFAPAGEDDSCLIRFIAGSPYQDIAFRIVDKEWDYSAKRDRGFRSKFDKVCMTLLPPDLGSLCVQFFPPHIHHLTHWPGHLATPFSLQEGNTYITQNNHVSHWSDILPGLLSEMIAYLIPFMLANIGIRWLPSRWICMLTSTYPHSCIRISNTVFLQPFCTKLCAGCKTVWYGIRHAASDRSSVPVPYHGNANQSDVGWILVA